MVSLPEKILGQLNESIPSLFIIPYPSFWGDMLPYFNNLPGE